MSGTRRYRQQPADMAEPILRWYLCLNQISPLDLDSWDQKSAVQKSSHTKTFSRPSDARVARGVGTSHAGPCVAAHRLRQQSETSHDILHSATAASQGSAPLIA